MAGAEKRERPDAAAGRGIVEYSKEWCGCTCYCKGCPCRERFCRTCECSPGDQLR